MGTLTFTARLEEANAPKTVAVIRKMLPLKSKIVHCRWSGESTWIPMGDRKLGLDFENHTSHPAPGMLLLYPGGISETELLFPYGSTMFASRVGQLAGNHFATLTQGQEQLPEIGRLTLWESPLPAESSLPSEAKCATARRLSTPPVSSCCPAW